MLRNDEVKKQLDACAVKHEEDKEQLEKVMQQDIDRIAYMTKERFALLKEVEDFKNSQGLSELKPRSRDPTHKSFYKKEQEAEDLRGRIGTWEQSFLSRRLALKLSYQREREHACWTEEDRAQGKHDAALHAARRASVLTGSGASSSSGKP
jgi:hypothetical protein